VTWVLNEIKRRASGVEDFENATRGLVGKPDTLTTKGEKRVFRFDK
jgi:hypothetical protein